MTILVKTTTGRERAIDMTLGGWESIPLESDMSKVRLSFEAFPEDDDIFVSIEEYNKIKTELNVSGAIFDFTKN